MEVGGEGEGRTNIVTARLYSTESRCTLNAALATFMQRTQTRKGEVLGHIEKQVDKQTFKPMSQDIPIIARDSD